MTRKSASGGAFSITENGITQGSVHHGDTEARRKATTWFSLWLRASLVKRLYDGVESPMQRVTISVPAQTYDAVIENGLIQHTGDLLRSMLGSQRKLFVVTVDQVRRKWGKK